MAIIRLESNRIRETSQKIAVSINGRVTCRPLYRNKIVTIAVRPCVWMGIVSGDRSRNRRRSVSFPASPTLFRHEPSERATPIGLHELDVPFEKHLVDLGNAESRAAFLKLVRPRPRRGGALLRALSRVKRRAGETNRRLRVYLSW